MGSEDAATVLAGVEAYLATSDYDCTAVGPFRAPSRPQPFGCFSDPACQSRLVVGHRMANPFAPENTLSALRAAILLGIDIVETDVRTTSDAQVVFIHDGDVSRTTDGIGDVSALSFDEVRALGIEPETDDPPGDFGCERLPSLDEVFALSVGQIIVELEVKATDAGVIAAEYLRDNNLYDHAFLLCDPGECAAARIAVPDVPIMTRPQSAEEVAASVDFDPTPIMVHIDPTVSFLTPAVVDQIHGVGAKIYGNAFVAGDALAVGQGDLGGYRGLYDDGIDVLQAENPHWLLQSLGRLEPR